MPLIDIRTAMRTRMLTVANVGVVTAYEPWASRDETLRTFFKHQTLAYLLGWTITRESTVPRPYALATDVDTHLMVTRGYRAVDNETPSETQFQDLVEAVRDKLRPTRWSELGDLGQVLEPPAVRIFEPRMFAGVLVHYVEIALRVEAVVSVAAG